MSSAAFTVTGASGTREMFADVRVTGGRAVVEVVDGGPAGMSLELLWEPQSGFATGGGPSRAVGGIERDGSSDVWFISGGGGSSIGLISLVIKAVAVLYPFGTGNDVPVGVVRSDYTIEATDVDPSASTISLETAVTVPDLEAIALMVGTDVGVTGTQPIAGAVQPGLPLADTVGEAQAQLAANVQDLSRDLAAEHAARENAEEARATAEAAKAR